MREISTPPEVLDLLDLDVCKRQFGSANPLKRLALRAWDAVCGKNFLHTSASMPFTPGDIRRAVRTSSLGELRDEELFYNGQDEQLLAFPFKLKQFCLSDRIDSSMIFFPEIESIRKIVAETLEENGNTVHRGALRVTIPDGCDSKSLIWKRHCRNHGIAVKKVSTLYPDECSHITAPFVVEGHPNLVRERYAPLRGADGSVSGCVAFAENHIGVPSLLDIERNLTLHQKIRVIVDAMKGCEYLHKNGKVHRDVKPGNILAFDEGNGEFSGKLCDHELVVDISDSAPEHILGTHGYLDLSWHSYGLDYKFYKSCPGIDVFAFGIVLIEIIYGKSVLECFLTEYKAKKSTQFKDADRDFVDKKRYFEKAVGFIKKADFDPKCPQSVIDLCFKMIVSDQDARPPLSEVISVLEREFSI